MLMPDWVFGHARFLVVAARPATVGAVAAMTTQMHHEHEREKANEDDPVDWNASSQKTSQRSKQSEVDGRSRLKHGELLGSTDISLIVGLPIRQGTWSRISG